MVPIKYVGLQHEWRDHLYNSGYTFKKGQAKQVEEHFAFQLLKHPEFADARPEKERTPLKFDRALLERRKELVDEPDLPPLVDLHSMTKEGLQQFAKSHFNRDLPARDLKAEMVEEVRLLVGRQANVVER